MPYYQYLMDPGPVGVGLFLFGLIVIGVVGGWMNRRPK